MLSLGPELAVVDRFGESFLCHQTCCWFYLQPCVGGDVMGLSAILLLELLLAFSGHSLTQCDSSRCCIPVESRQKQQTIVKISTNLHVVGILRSASHFPPVAGAFRVCLDVCLRCLRETWGGSRWWGGVMLGYPLFQNRG